MVHTLTNVRRGGTWQRVHLETIVPGDVVKLAAGDLVPGDCLLLSAKDLHVSEAALTGESFPVEKHVGICEAETPLPRRSNTLFQGSNIINGEAEALVVHTGSETEFGKIATSLETTEDETAFEQGINRFGYLLMRITFVLAAGILILNLFFHKPLVASILFALALAVGLAPELLPAIMVTTLSAGAARMAKEKVIVKKLAAIQNLGGINILCSDKTGTLTTGEVQVHSTVGLRGQHSDKVRLFAWLNAYFETGFTNPLDEAIRKNMASETGVSEYTKFDEVPYDFIRKRLSIVVEKDGKHLMLTKGALQNVLDICTKAEDEDGSLCPLDEVRPAILELFKKQSAEGFRTIGVAWRDVTGDPIINKDDEMNMTFLGFIFLFDPPKPGIVEAVQSLEKLGISLKIITGDNRLAAHHVADMLGLEHHAVLTGERLRHISDEALPARAMKTDIFAEIEPNQKERLIRALRKGGNVVGFLGDGINDASALRAADVGISVDGAVDVAKEASDMILLEKNLDVLRAGILEGRKTYLNTLKYIFITTSANFGNMFSLAGVSLFIPFLPLLPQQILLLNFLSDIPALGIAADRVDEEQLAKPKRWDVKLIRRFMTVFGIQSSIFDYLTFGVLLLVFKVDEAHFQTGWFVESCLTELFILLIVRTTRPAWRSRPTRFLLWASIFVAAIVLTVPYLPIGKLIGFDPLPPLLLLGMISIAVLYAVMAEVTKGRFFKKNSHAFSA
jgi:P-type Mg2+ transporter